MTTDLTRARRKLAQLKTRRDVLRVAECICAGKWEREARRMSREIAREIRDQELECRRLALTGPCWVASHFRSPHLCRNFTGQRAKAHAVAYAKKQNRKAKKEGGQ
jgi:hypothetical protein